MYIIPNIQYNEIVAYGSLSTGEYFTWVKHGLEHWGATLVTSWPVMTRLSLIVAIAACAACTSDSDPTSPALTIGPSVTVPDPSEDPSWFRVVIDDNGDRMLEVGTLSRGLTISEPMPDKGAAPAPGAATVLGSEAGVVVFLSDGAGESQLIAVDAAAGESRVALTTTDRLIGGRLSPDGATAYVLIADRAMGSLVAIVATDVTTGATRELADLASEHLDPASALYLSLDGSALLLDACRDNSCELRLISINTGASSTLSLRPPSFQPIGMTSLYVVGRPACEEGPCGRWLVERSTGDLVSDPPAAGTYVTHAVIKGADGHELVVGQLSGVIPWGEAPRAATDPPVLHIVDLTTGHSLQLDPELYALEVAHAPLDPNTGVELPAGWVLVSGITSQGDETISYFAVNVTDGQVRDLRQLGELDRP